MRPQEGLVGVDASSAPSPQPPATWKTIRESFAIWSSATSLHFARSSQSWEYPLSTSMPGTAASAPAW